MIVFLLLFVGLPIAMSLVFGDKDRTIAYWMPMTLMIVFVLWTIISLPCVLMQTKFHVPLYIFIVVMILLVGFLVFMLIKRRKVVKEKVKEFFASDFMRLFTNAFFIVMLVLILFQAGRVTIFEPIGYSDNKTYVALANDILESDTFYTINDVTGATISDMSQVPTKYLLSGWYSFEAVLSVLFHSNPATVIYTLLPGYLIILSYLVWWCIGRKLFYNNINSTSLFVMFSVILYESITAGICDLTVFLTSFPTFGKSVDAKIIVPLIVYVWIILSQSKKTRKTRDIIEIVILVMAGCSASSMGIMIMPIEMGFLTITDFIVNKRIEARAVLRLILTVIPAALFLMLYLVFDK